VVNGLLWRRHLAQEGFVVGRVVNEGRVRLGLKPLRHTEQAQTGPGTVLAVDPLFARLPDDVVKGGEAGIRQAHYWYHEGAETALDDGTARFLDAGDPPVMVSFGSADSLVKDAAAAYARLCDTLTGRGLRVLLVSAVPVHPVRQDAVHQAAFVPHAKAMPRCRLVIHHGGIGTVFAAARAGTPQLVVPRMLDQFYWAARVSEMQIGYGLLPAADPGAPVIGTAVDRLLADEVVAQRVRAARDALTSPDRAVEVDAAVRDIFSVT
jgi:vancomycin aglycone glucosyltransferase